MTLGLAVILISIFCVISIDKIYSLTIPVGLLPTITGLRPRLNRIPMISSPVSRKSARNQVKEHWQTISLPRQCEFQMPDSTYLAGPFPYHFLLLRWLLISLQETFFHHIQSFLLISSAELYDRCAKNKRGFSLDGWKSKEFMPLSLSR